MRPLDDASCLGVVGQRVGDAAAQAVVDLVDHFVVEAAAVVDIQHLVHADAADAVAQGVQRGDGRFGQVDGEADDAAGAPVDDHRHLGPEDLAGQRVDDLGIEGVAVRHPYVIRPEQVGLAALEGFQRLEFVRTHAALLAGLRAQLGEEAAHRVDAWAAGILRPEVLIGRFDTGLLRLLVVLEEYRRPHRHAHVRLAPSRCQGDLAMLAVVGQPAL
ncbi:hypothetical protein D9M68_775220 [compost metagenome]